MKISRTTFSAEEWPLFSIYIIVISGLQIKRSTEPGKILKAVV
jgi:hypothetical protein